MRSQERIRCESSGRPGDRETVETTQQGDHRTDPPNLRVRREVSDHSKREVETKMKEAVRTNDPELLEQVLKPSKEVRQCLRS